MTDPPGIILTFPHPLGTPGGGTVHCIQLARHLKKAGARVWLLPLQSGGLISGQDRSITVEVQERSQEVRKELRSAGVEVHPVPVSRLHFIFDGLPMCRAVRHILKREKVDAVISWHHESTLLPVLVKMYGAGQYMMAAGSYGFLQNRTRRNLLLKFLLLRNFWRSRIVFTSSRFSRQEIAETFKIPPEKISIVPLGIPASFFEARRAFSPERPVRLFFLGQISFHKGFFDLIEVLGELKERGDSDWELQAAGRGQIDQAKTLAAALGIASQVHFLGFLEGDIIIRHLEEAQIAVLPSYTESFGLAVAESLAAGLPVIAYAAGAVPELVRDGRSGWLVPLGDKDALAHAIADAIRDLERSFQMGLTGRSDMLDRFTWE